MTSLILLTIKSALRGGDDLFAQQRAAEALDQVEGAALNLVGAVDRQIDLRILGKGGERDVERARLRRGPFRRRDSDDLQPLRDPRSEALDNEISGRPGAEADDHSVLDVLDRALRRGFL